MRKRSARQSRHTNTLGFALFIGALIALLIATGIAIKIFLLFRASVFDGKHQFSMEIKEPQQERFIVFNPQDSSIHTLLLHGNVSRPQVGLGIPVDASLVSRDDISSLSELAKDLLLDRKSLHATTTIIDGINLFIFTHTADNSKSVFQEIFSSADTATKDTILTKVFTDPTLYKEGKSIAIVNATGISGFGTEVGKLLIHMGANVVSVTTADSENKTSAILYTGDTSYTLTRLGQVLHIPTAHVSTPSVSDITITLGTDFSDTFRY